ncbi:MAG: glycoside hydrolase family 2 TIM barrel-domain containing protein, partial [Ginsengibacter sp.]
MKICFTFLICTLSFYTSQSQQEKTPTPVKIIKKASGFQLLVNKKPYYIKGAVGSDYLEKLQQYGGNAIRTGSEVNALNKAHTLGLTALVNLPVEAERDGMDYDDTAAVRAQHANVMRIVRDTKNHPAVVMWALGNELDFIQPNVKEHYNIKVWDAVNALSREIHKIDPNHPVM